MEKEVARDAYNVLENLSAKQARRDFREAMYKSWVESENMQDREKLHGIATGSEMFWRIMERYAATGKMEIEGLTEMQEQQLRAVD